VLGRALSLHPNADTLNILFDAFERRHDFDSLCERAAAASARAALCAEARPRSHRVGQTGGRRAAAAA
jgi:hypothetical protein